MPVFIVDKPLGLSSHDVVATARQRLGTRRVGHAGTLDPLATGVLVMLSEEATKLSPFLSGSDKRYLAWISFGAGTPTLDAEGPISDRADANHLTAGDVAAALLPFLELSEQLPPRYSAVKRGGVRSYQAARRGEDFTLSARPAGYRWIELLAFAPQLDALPATFAPDASGRWQPRPEGRSFPRPDPLGDHPTALVSLEVQAGTYVRALARDLGATLRLPAHLSGLVRTRSGQFDLQQAQPLESLDPETGRGLADSLPYPLETIDQEEARRVRQGQRLPIRRGERHGLVDPAGELVAVVEGREGRMRLLRVFPAVVHS